MTPSPTATATAGASPTPTSTPTLALGLARPLQYTPLDVDADDYGTVLTDTYRVFGDATSWSTFVTAHGGSPRPLRGVNWNNELVIAVFAGQQVTPTVGVRIESIGLLGDQIIVRVEAGAPPATATPPAPTPTATATPGPHHLVTIDRDDLPTATAPTVVFIDRAGTILEQETIGVVLQRRPSPARAPGNLRGRPRP